MTDGNSFQIGLNREKLSRISSSDLWMRIPMLSASLMNTFALPKKSEDEKKIRDAAIHEATKAVILVPLKVMETALSGFGLIREMVEEGNPNSLTDAGVGALALRACIKGAYLNVKINASTLDDKDFVREILIQGCDIDSKAKMEEDAIMKMVDEKIVRAHKN